MSEIFEHIFSSHLIGFIAVMFSAFIYPYISKKGKPLATKSKEAGVLAGLITFVGYTTLEIKNSGFDNLAFQGKFGAIILVSTILMILTSFFAFCIIDKERI